MSDHQSCPVDKLLGTRIAGAISYEEYSAIVDKTLASLQTIRPTHNLVEMQSYCIEHVARHMHTQLVEHIHDLMEKKVIELGIDPEVFLAIGKAIAQARTLAKLMGEATSVTGPTPTDLDA